MARQIKAKEKKIKEILKADNLTVTDRPHNHSRQKGKGKYNINTPIVQELRGSVLFRLFTSRRI